MQLDESFFHKMISKDLTEFIIRVALIAFLVVVSLRIFSPFMGLVLWALVLAVTLYPLHRKLAKRMGDKQGRAATLLVLAGVLLIGVPTIMLGSSFASQVHDLHTAFENNAITINPPKPSVAEWPLVGEKLHAAWSLAANDLPAFLEKLQPQLGTVSKWVLGIVASSAGAILSFIGSLIIAGIMMAYGESGAKAMLQIMTRLAGPREGPHLHSLSVATIRSVAMGVIGVAFIQALLLGVGFLAAGIPAAGLLALIALLLGIAQLPALLISLPVIAFLWWSGDSTIMNVVFTVYLLVMGMADNVLKPLMLGRGVDAPMPIILIGALGGMVAGGMIGLFLGAVFLTLAYKIFMEWVAEADRGENEPVATESERAPEPTK
jgi:predicted PurR-regulated permease PerM